MKVTKYHVPPCLLGMPNSSSTQHGIHQRSHGFLIRNLHHLIILVHILFQLYLGIKWHSNGFAILHAKAFKNLLEIANLVDINKDVVHNPFPFPCQGRNANHQDLSFQIFKKVLLHLQKLVIIIAHQDEIIDVEDNEKFDISNLRNIHITIHITFHKLNVFQRKHLAFGSKLLNIVSNHTKTCEAYTQDVCLLV
jgi:hypothetical protein